MYSLNLQFKFIMQCKVPCFSYFLYFTCGRLSIDFLGKDLCQRGKIKTSSLTHPWLETSQGYQERGEIWEGILGVGRKEKWLNAVSEIKDGFKLINVPLNLPILVSNRHLQPKSKPKYLISTTTASLNDSIGHFVSYTENTGVTVGFSLSLMAVPLASPSGCTFYR